MLTEFTEDIRILNINASVRRGGWECNFQALSDSDIVEVNQNVRTRFRGAFGGPPGPERTAFNGYVLPTRIEFDRTASKTTFQAQTSDGYLRRGWLQGLGLADRDALARCNYHQWDSVTGGGERLTMGRIVEHCLGHHDALGNSPGAPTCPNPITTNPDWVAHTNMVYHPADNPHGWIDLTHVETTPFDAATNPDGTMRVNKYNVRETDNLWSRLTEIADNEFFVIYFDKTDTLHYTRHPMFRTVIPPPVMTFDADFCSGLPVLEPRSSRQLRQLRLHAVTDDGDTLHAEYPASPTHVYGKVEEVSRIRCNAQATLDSWCERMYNFMNRDYTARWPVMGLSGLMLEILDRIQITYSGTAANGVHVDWTEKKFWVHDITVTPDESQTSGQSLYVLEAESS